MTNRRKKPLTAPQLKTFRFYRDKGFSISEAKRLARMTYNQLAVLLSERLRELANRSVVKE